MVALTVGIGLGADVTLRGAFGSNCSEWCNVDCYVQLLFCDACYIEHPSSETCHPCGLGCSVAECTCDPEWEWLHNCSNTIVGGPCIF